MNRILIVSLTFLSSIIMAQIPTYLPTNGLQGWWPFCGNANDLTVNANNGVVYGASLTTDRFGNSNNSYFFNGSSHIETTYAGILGANKRAVSFWAKTSDATNPMTGVSWGKSESFPNTGKKFGCEFNIFSSGLTIDGADCAITYNTPSAHADNNWHHYVYQMDSASLLNQVQIFMDGVLVTSVATDFRGTSTMITLPNYNVWFGKMDNGLPYYFNGSLDDIAIWNRKLTPTEITALYTGSSPCLTTTPTPTVNLPSCIPTSSLTGWWPFCGNANDESGNAHHGTPLGATLTTDRFGNSNNAYFFNGSSHIETTYVGVLGANKRAVSFWAKTSDATNPMTGVSWGKSESFPNTGKKFGCEFNIFSTGLTIDGADCAITYNTPSAHADNNWHHYVYQMDSASLLNQVQIFMDGVLVTSVATDFRGTSTMITLPNYNVWFGKMDNGLPYYFNGSLDDIAIWNRKLTQTEITALFNCTSSCATTSTVIPTPTITPTPTISVLPLPNVITPNNDGVNDYIDFAKHITEKEFDFEIFDRWGLSMMKSSNASKTTWDGTTTSGQKCVDGVYFYIIKTVDKSYKGNISLFK